MVLRKCTGKRILNYFTYKTCGVTAIAFCVGTVAGLCFPVALIAFLEAVMLFLLAWVCLVR